MNEHEERPRKKPRLVELALGLLLLAVHGGITVYILKDGVRGDGGLAAVVAYFGAIFAMLSALAVLAIIAAALGSRSAIALLVVPGLGVIFAFSLFLS